MSKTAMQQAIELLEQKKGLLQDLEDTGVLHKNEYIHKANEISSIQITFSKLLPLEKQHIIDAYFAGYNYEGGRTEEQAEQYYKKTFH
jgi:chromatin segregation and condensation protein Rec8/ScpA/Scc1 (kleisin family)